MTLLSKILKAIYELDQLGCKRENLRIAFPNIAEKQLEYELSHYGRIQSIGGITDIDNIKCLNTHPHNELLVYDVIHSTLNSSLIKTIIKPLISDTLTEYTDKKIIRLAI